MQRGIYELNLGWIRHGDVAQRIAQEYPEAVGMFSALVLARGAPGEPDFGILFVQLKDGERRSTIEIAVLLLAVLVVYMELAAQCESLRHPFVIMLALPLALFGAFVGLWIMG